MPNTPNPLPPQNAVNSVLWERNLGPVLAQSMQRKKEM